MCVCFYCQVLPFIFVFEPICNKTFNDQNQQMICLLWHYFYIYAFFNDKYLQYIPQLCKCVYTSYSMGMYILTFLSFWFSLHTCIWMKFETTCRHCLPMASMIQRWLSCIMWGSLIENLVLVICLVRLKHIKCKRKNIRYFSYTSIDVYNINNVLRLVSLRW